MDLRSDPIISSPIRNRNVNSVLSSLQSKQKFIDQKIAYITGSYKECVFACKRSYGKLQCCCCCCCVSHCALLHTLIGKPRLYSQTVANCALIQSKQTLYRPPINQTARRE